MSGRYVTKAQREEEWNESSGEGEKSLKVGVKDMRQYTVFEELDEALAAARREQEENADS